MAETYKLLDQRALTNSPAGLYTVASGFSYIKNIVCCNNDLAANKSITLFVVKPGGAADNSSCVAREVPLGPGESVWIKVDLFLQEGGSIIGLASVTGIVSCTISGVEVTA